MLTLVDGAVRRLKSIFTARLATPIRRRFAPTKVICQMRGGYKMRLQPSADEFEMRMFLDREYEPATLALFDKVLRPGDTMVDIGANLGLMSLHASRLVGRNGLVVALEPHPFNYARLLENIELNHVQNVRPYKVAAGAIDDEMLIFDASATNVGGASLIAPSDGKGSSAGEVKVRPLDQILAALDIRSARLLKIDVEGFEYQVLKGAKQSLLTEPIICMEFGGSDRFHAYRLIIQSGSYGCYLFSNTKFSASPLVEVNQESELRSLPDFENIVYIPRSVYANLPPSLFKQ